MRSSAEPSTQLQYNHLDSALKAAKDTVPSFTENTNIDTNQTLKNQPKTTITQRDTLYKNLEKTQLIIISQQQKIDSLLNDMKKKK